MNPRKIAENFSNEFVIPELRERGTNLLVELLKCFHDTGRVEVLKEFDEITKAKASELGAVYKKEFKK